MCSMKKKIRVENLDEFTLTELKEIYLKEFKSDPPKNRSLIERALTYRIQEKEKTSLKAKHEKSLKNSLLKENSKKIDYNLSVGQKLTKIYNGKTYEVLVAKDSFVYKNEHYKSLSKIAKLITGTHLSGPFFFNLKGRKNDKN
jgi:hypothetical protein